MKSLDSQMGLIAKLNEIKEQLDSSCSGSEGGNENEAGSDSDDASREKPNSSDPKKHAGYSSYSQVDI